MRTFLSRAIFVILLVLSASGWARSASSGVHVHGYTARSGHYVAPYTRSAPHTYHVPAQPSPAHPSPRSTSLSSHASTHAAAGGDNHGRSKRSETAKRDFERHHACPSTGKTSGACPGYVIDHIVPLNA